jgi:hypothetical protein
LESVRRVVLGQHVPFSVHAPSAACPLELDQGAKEERLGLRVRDIHDGARIGNPFADSCEAGGKAARISWKPLARGGEVRGGTGVRWLVHTDLWQ